MMNGTRDDAEMAALRDEMDRVVLALDVPAHRLEQVARRKGAAIRRRRAAGASVAFVVVAGVAVGAVYATLPGTGEPTRSVPAAASPTASAESSTEPQRVTVPEQWWTMTAEQMARVLDAQLPADVTITDATIVAKDPAPGQARKPLQGHLHATLHDARSGGTGEIEILLAPPPTSDLVSYIKVPTGASSASSGVPRTSPESSLASVDCTAIQAGECTTLRDEAGRPYGIVYVETQLGATVRGANVTTPDDGLIAAVVSNDASGEKWSSPVTAEGPVLTELEVRAIAESSAWFS